MKTVVVRNFERADADTRAAGKAGLVYVDRLEAD
jgi:hypothetical protein